MNPTPEQLKQIGKLVDGVAMSKSIVVRGKIIWAWRSLNSAQRKRVDAETRCETLDADHLDRVLEAKTLASNAVRRG